MKFHLTIIALLLAFTAVGQNITMRTKTGQTIRICYSQSENACDTLYIDNQKYFILFSGYSGEIISKKYTDWSIELYGVKDPRSGRLANSEYLDLDLKCYVFVGNNQENKRPNKIFIYNHGMSCMYYPSTFNRKP